MVLHAPAASLQFREVNRTRLLGVDQPLHFAVERPQFPLQPCSFPFIALVNHGIPVAFGVARLENITIRE